MTIWGIALLVALSAAAHAAAESVEVTLKDGRQYLGTLVSETKFKIVVRVTVSGIDTEMTFTLADVKEIQRLKPDAAPAPVPAPKPDAGDGKAWGGYAIVPVNGEFGHTITLQFFEDVLIPAAKRNGAELVIVHLNSGGGAADLPEAICDALANLRREGPRAPKIAFYVDENAFSAAAMLVLANPDLYVAKHARIGGCVRFSGGSKDDPAVLAKWNAIELVSWRSRFERAGHPAHLADAVMVTETQLFADKSESPWRLTIEPPESTDALLPKAAKPNPWTEIDGANSVLVMTAEEAHGMGAAKEILESPHSIPARYDLLYPDRIAFDGEALWRKHTDAVERDILQIKDTFDKMESLWAAVESRPKESGDREDQRQIDEAVRKIRSQLLQIASHIRSLEGMTKSKEHAERWMLSRGITKDVLRSRANVIQNLMRDLK